MTVPTEYNVIGGLIGLGPDILLDVLSEIRLVPNAVQFIGSCKKTLQLINHSRFYGIIESLNYPIEIHNPDPTDIEFADIDGVQKKITKKQTKPNTISLTQVIDQRVWTMEVEFQNAGNGTGAVGIVRDTYKIPDDANPIYQPHNQHIVQYGGKSKSSGWVKYNGNEVSGNVEFIDNQIIKLQLNTITGTLIFFVDGIQQPIFVSGINEKIYLRYSESSCIIRSLKRLSSPTSGHVTNEKSIIW